MNVAQLEAEFIVVGGGKKAEVAVKPLREKGSHIEVVAARPTLMQTLTEAFSRAHFSQILVGGLLHVYSIYMYIHTLCTYTYMSGPPHSQSPQCS